MHKFNINHKNVLAPTLLALTAIVFLNSVNTVDAFQIKGGNRNLEITQSNKAQSSNFYVNARLKPTSFSSNNKVVVNDTSIIRPVIITPATPTTPNTTITTTRPSSTNDSSSPYLGTANQSYANRSAEATARRKAAEKKLVPSDTLNEENEITHAAAPKTNSLPNPLQDQIISSEKTSVQAEEEIKLPVVNKLKKEDSAISILEVKKSSEVGKVDVIEAKDSKLINNSAKFSLKFLDKNIVDELQKEEKSTCSIRYSNYGKNPHWNILANTLFLVTIGLTLIIFCLAILVYMMWQNSLKKK